MCSDSTNPLTIMCEIHQRICKRKRQAQHWRMCAFVRLLCAKLYIICVCCVCCVPTVYKACRCESLVCVQICLSLAIKMTTKRDGGDAVDLINWKIASFKREGARERRYCDKYYFLCISQFRMRFKRKKTTTTATARLMDRFPFAWQKAFLPNGLRRSQTKTMCRFCALGCLSTLKCLIVCLAFAHTDDDGFWSSEVIRCNFNYLCACAYERKGEISINVIYCWRQTVRHEKSHGVVFLCVSFMQCIHKQFSRPHPLRGKEVRAKSKCVIYVAFALSFFEILHGIIRLWDNALEHTHFLENYLRKLYNARKRIVDEEDACGGGLVNGDLFSSVSFSELHNSWYKIHVTNCR